MGAGDIIKGHVNEVFGLNEKISANRLRICYACPLYSKKLGGVCNNKLYLNVDTGEVSKVRRKGFKNGCGCLMSRKAKLVSSKCPINKW